MFCLRRTPLLTASALLAISLTVEAADSSIGRDQAIREKSETPITATASAFLNERDGNQQRVWVFFTDKGAVSRSSSLSAAAVPLSDRTRARRERLGIATATFADLPVAHDYVNAVSSLGAEHRQTSRWLNAASFVVDPATLTAIAALPYVAKITPIAGFATPEPDLMELTREAPPAATDATALSYGSSLAQLQQINVPAVHEAGRTGKGVTLAIMDSGFRTSHAAFSPAYAAGRVIAEWDFVRGDGNTSQEPGDHPSQWNHGTLIWSVAAGNAPGTMFGPAYEANIILCKTEDYATETPVEEDNWVAALEFADSLGADVATTSLGYSDWYTYADMDGQTAVITLAVNTAASLGIIALNSMGNSGPSPGTLTAPADGFDMLSIGSVSASGNIATSSSRGPTFDGRIKPDVVARGVNTFAASSSGGYTQASGTSLSTPLVSGVVTLLRQAFPDASPAVIMDALRTTADRASTPDNTYGYGLIDAMAAHDYLGTITVDTTIGNAPMAVSFATTTQLAPTAWLWDFGDGNQSTAPAPTHSYQTAGQYTVSLTVTTPSGTISTSLGQEIVVLGDTVSVVTDSVFAGQPFVSSIQLTNSQPLMAVTLPFSVESQSTWPVAVDSVVIGERLDGFGTFTMLFEDKPTGRFAPYVSSGNAAVTLPPGSGEAFRVYGRTDSRSFGQDTWTVTPERVVFFDVELQSPVLEYVPVVDAPPAATYAILRGDVDYSGSRGLPDLSALISFLFLDGPEPITLQSGDVNADYAINLTDINRLIDYLFITFTPIPEP